MSDTTAAPGAASIPGDVSAARNRATTARRFHGNNAASVHAGGHANRAALCVHRIVADRRVSARARARTAVKRIAGK